VVGTTGPTPPFQRLFSSTHVPFLPAIRPLLRRLATIFSRYAPFSPSALQRPMRPQGLCCRAISHRCRRAHPKEGRHHPTHPLPAGLAPRRLPAASSPAAPSCPTFPAATAQLRRLY